MIPTSQEAEEYKYYMRARPLDIGTVPKGFTRFDEDDLGKEKGGRYGAVFYDHPLSEKEVAAYELIPAAEPKHETIYDALHGDENQALVCPDTADAMPLYSSGTDFHLRPSVTFEDLDDCLRKGRNPCSILTRNPFNMNEDLEDAIVKAYSERFHLPEEGVARRFTQCVINDRNLPMDTNICKWVRTFDEAAANYFEPTATFEDFYYALGDGKDAYHLYCIGGANEHPVAEPARAVIEQLSCIASYATMRETHCLPMVENQTQDVKEFYELKYPTDTEGAEYLRYGATFQDLDDALMKREDPEAVIMTDGHYGLDSVVRERIMQEIAERSHADYDQVYDAWFYHYDHKNDKQPQAIEPKVPELTPANPPSTVTIQSQADGKTGKPRFVVDYYPTSLLETGKTVYAGNSLRKALKEAGNVIQPTKGLAK